MPDNAMGFYHPSSVPKRLAAPASGNSFFTYLIVFMLIAICFYRRSIKKAQLLAEKESDAKKMQDECLIDELSKTD